MPISKELGSYLLRAHIDYVTGGVPASVRRRSARRASFLYSAALVLLSAAIFAFGGN